MCALLSTDSEGNAAPHDATFTSSRKLRADELSIARRVWQIALATNLCGCAGVAVLALAILRKQGQGTLDATRRVFEAGYLKTVRAVRRRSTSRADTRRVSVGRAALMEAPTTCFIYGVLLAPCLPFVRTSSELRAMSAGAMFNHPRAHQTTFALIQLPAKQTEHSFL